MLNHRAVLPVVAARQRRIGPAGDLAEVGRARANLGGLNVAGGVEDSAVARDVVPGDGLGRLGHAVERLGKAGGLRRDVLADVGLERRLAGAEQIVSDRKAGRPVVPVGNIRNRREVARADPRRRGRRLGRHRGVEMLEARPVVQRHPLHRPGVLCIAAEVAVDALDRRGRRVVDHDLERKVVHTRDVDLDQQIDVGGWGK